MERVFFLWILLVFSCAGAGAPVAAPRDSAPKRASYLITVTDDFIVDVYHNGKMIPEARRQLLAEEFGATAERISVNVSKGDWLVFNVVNNRLRWGGAYYFAVAGLLAPGEFGFVSDLASGQWSVCDDSGDAKEFIRNRSFLSSNKALPVERQWHDGPELMRKYAGEDWEGEPLWGRSRNTWIKVRVD